MPDRVAAVGQFWAQQQGLGAVGREAMKSLAWSNKNPGPVRVRALEILADQPGEADKSDFRAMTRLMLPNETEFTVVRFIAARAGRGGWREHAGPLARAWSRSLASVPDAERPERAALLALYPESRVEQTLMSIFATPATGEGRQLEWAEKARLAAWEVLARLDPQGAQRSSLLASAPAAPGDRLMENLRAAAADLRAVPITAAQLKWVNTLRDFDDPQRGAANRQWWGQASAALASLAPGQQATIALRHAEPVRWCSVHRPDWLRQDRNTLLDRLRGALKGQERAARFGSSGSGFGTALDDIAQKLSWADLLTIAVFIEAIRPSSSESGNAASAAWIADGLWTQAEQDRADTSTEYGGLIAWTETAAGAASGGGRWKATLYPPRATQRFGDERFVASDDMLNDGGRALAHYHFHAQRLDNADYAGPGPGDLLYATEQGRACLVFTPLRRGTLAVSYYQPGSVVVELGTLTASPAAAAASVKGR